MHINPLEFCRESHLLSTTCLFIQPCIYMRTGSRIFMLSFES